jgi:hypothetical protein
MYEKTGNKSIALAFNRGTGLNDLCLTGKYTLIVTRLFAVRDAVSGLSFRFLSPATVM